MGGAKPPGWIEPKIFLEEGIRDVITCFKFGDDRFIGLASAEGQILPFPIDFDGRPYNTLTLPCERVMTDFFCAVSSIVKLYSLLVNCLPVIQLIYYLLNFSFNRALSSQAIDGKIPKVNLQGWAYQARHSNGWLAFT